jgi:predicted phosphohydrolase
MQIQYCSDLHFEFRSNRDYLKNHPVIPTGEILLLAGDITPFGEMNKHSDLISTLADQFEAVYWVPGNHEYYGSDITVKPIPLLEKVRSNFFLVNNQQVQYKNINLVFSTLWSKISPRNEWDIRQSLTDFHIIMAGQQKFSPVHFNSLHHDSLAFLGSVAKNGNTIVVTHHVPTLQHYPPAYKNSPLTEAFAVELFDFIETSGIAHWIYGHHHTNIPPFNIGSTQLLTNQLGYVDYNEHKLFQRDACILMNGVS